MRKIQTAAAALLLSSSLWAANGNCCSGNFGVWAEALYWKPVNGGVDWVQTFSGEEINFPTITADKGIESSAPDGQVPLSGVESGTFKRRHICPDYNWGFRVGGEYECLCFFTRLSGLYIHFRDSACARGILRPVLPASVVNDFFTTSTFVYVPALQIVGVGHGRRELDHWNVDLRFGQYFIKKCACQLYAYGGIRYVDLEETVHVKLCNTAHVAGIQPLLPLLIDQRIRSEFSGAGPEVGIGGRAKIWCDFGISGEIGVLGIIGSRKAVAKNLERIDFPNAPESVEAKQCYRYDSCTVILPAVDMRLGLNYSRQCSCLTGLLEVGYELNHYWNALNTPDGVTNVIDTHNGRTFLRDIGFAGPYIMLKLTY